MASQFHPLESEKSPYYYTILEHVIDFNTQYYKGQFSGQNLGKSYLVILAQFYYIDKRLFRKEWPTLKPQKMGHVIPKN